MRKIYLLIMLFMSTTAMTQTPIITSIVDGDCSGGNPRVIEIFAQGSVDFTQYSIQLQSNGGSWGTLLDLTSLGTITDEFVYVHKGGGSLAAEFPSVTNTLDAGTSSVANFNGDDGIRIIITANSTVIDQYGEDAVDGTGEVWEYQDGYAKRKNNTGPDAGFNPLNWDYFNGALDQLCNTTTYEVITNAGSYTFAADPTITTSASTVSGFLQFLGNPSAEQTVDVSGMNLTDDATVTVNSGDYEISLTSGGTFGASVTIPQSSGVIVPTPVYIRLNGTTAVNPSNGELTITSAGATDVTVDLEGEIALPAPTITASDTAISGFSHFVGTPSAADSFMVEGFNLTDNITVSVPTSFEVSETLGGTYDASVTLTQSGGTVASTKVYVRLNGPAKNLNQVGDVTISSTDATDQTIALTGETLDYTAYSIGDVTGVDADGVADSVDVYVTITGVVHCGDFRNNGYDVVIIDDNNDGITMFNTSDVDGYTPAEGDRITVLGQIGQYNGLIQISPATITLDASNETLQTPTSVSDLDETTESQYIQLDSVTLVNGETEWTGNTNFDVTDGTTTFSVRVPNDASIVGTTIPNGPIRIIGVGKQFDSSSPFDSGYQIFPCSVTPLCTVDVTTALDDATITATATGLNYQWIDCSDNSIIVGETGVSYTATVSGSYAVIITDGTCVDTSTCVTVNISSLNDNDFAGVKIYPNPVKEVLHISNENGTLQSVEVVSATGSIVYSSTISSSNFTVNTAQLNAGVYFVNVRTENSAKTFKVIK